MDDIFETRIKNYKDNEQDDLNIENFKPLSNKNKDDSITDPLTMNLQKFTLKKSASYVSPNYNKNVNIEEVKRNSKDFNITHKTNSVNTTNLFNNNINFTTLNEGNKNNFHNKNNMNDKENNIKSFL